MKHTFLTLTILPVILLTGCVAYDPYYDPPLAPIGTIGTTGGVYTNVPSDVSVTFGTYTPYPYTGWGWYPNWGDGRWKDDRYNDRWNWHRDNDNWRWHGMQNRPSAPELQRNRNYGGYGASPSWQRSNSGHDWNLH